MDDPYYETRRAVVRQISRDRTAVGLDSVQLDPFASSVSDQHCQEMAGRGYLSHWNLPGLLPHQRYHLAGGRDHVQENLSRATIISHRPAPIPTSPTEILPHLLRAHARLMDEQPPLDGHRKNILDPAHTHVGIGFAVVGGEFTLAQLFVNRYAQLQELPRQLPKGSIPVEGVMLRRDYGPYYCALFYEGEPRPQTPAELNQTYAYSDMEGEICGEVPPWKMQFDPGRGRFYLSVPIQERGPGYYHLLLWARDRVRSIPYRLSADEFG